MKKKKYIVTGGYGFIGSHIVDKLSSLDYDVIVIDNQIDNEKKFINPRAKYYQFDLSEISYQNEVIKIIEGAEGVFHCAALIDVQESLQNPHVYEKNNTLSTMNILNLCVKANIPRLIFSSSAAVYGNNENVPLSEKDLCSPISPYGLQKLYGEKLCKMFSKTYGINTASLRYFNIFGERQKISGTYAAVVGIFMKQFNSNMNLTVRGNGKQSRDFIYVGDIVSANIKAMESNKELNGDVYNIGSGKQMTILDLAKIFNKKISFVNAVQEIYSSQADISKAINELNWKPTVDIKDWVEKNIIL